MRNELTPKTDTKLDIKINPLAAFGIAATATVGLCFCICTGMKYGYKLDIGKLSLTPSDCQNLLTA